MSIRVKMHQAKSDLSRLAAKAQPGEEVIIMRSSKRVAKIVAIRHQRVAGLARGRFELAPDFDAPLPEEVLDSFDT